MRRLIILNVLLALSYARVFAQTPTPAQSPPELSESAVYEKNKAAVVQINVTGTLRATNQVDDRLGTGFLIHRDGYVITAGHVVGANTEWQESPNGKLSRSVGVKILGTERPVSVTVLYVDQQLDLALLRVSCPSACPTVVLAPAPVLRPAIPVRAVVWSGGAKSEPRSGTTANENDWSYGGAIKLIMNNIEEGHSGAPVFDAHNGYVIGVVKAGKRYTPGVAYAMSINLATSLITMTWHAAAIEQAIDVLAQVRTDEKAELFPSVIAKFKTVDKVLEQLKQNIHLVPSLSTLPNPNAAAGGTLTFLNVQLQRDFEEQYLPTSVVVKTTPAWHMTLKGTDASKSDVPTAMSISESRTAGYIIKGDAQSDDIKSVRVQDLPLGFPVDPDLKAWLKAKWSLSDATLRTLTITTADVEMEWKLPPADVTKPDITKKATVRGVSTR